MRPLKQHALAIIAGRDTISPTDALECLGRATGGLSETSVLAGLAARDIGPGPDGMVTAADVLAAIDRQSGRLRRRSEPAWDAPVELRRAGHAAWSVLVPWANLGRISAVAYSREPLARPARWLGTWIAEIDHPDTDTHDRVGAVSARAAQILVVRETCPQVILPAWAANVRDLDDDLALAAQAVADAKGNGDPIPSDTGLTDWEIEEIAPIANPAWTVWESALAATGDPGLADTTLAGRFPDTYRRALEVTTPAALALRTSGNTRSPRWSTRAVATHLGVNASTVRSWHSRGQMPAPDGHDEDGRPWWLPRTITDWEPTRPGKGWRAKE